MTKFILVRHGQSQANLEEAFAGHYNAPLTDYGHAQARATAKYVTEHYRIDAIYSSDLMRAYDTGKPASELLGIGIVPREDLREIFEGEWSGMRFVDIAERFPEDFSVWRQDIGHARCTGGESTAELLVRVRQALLEIARENDGKTVLVTTHATPIRVMQTFAETGSLDEMKNVKWVTNASVSELEYDDGKWRMTRVSYDEHLGELKLDRPRNV